jgi:L-Ala-D/L-Glu epimerase
VELSFQTLELQTRHAFHIARMAAPPVRRSVWIRLRDDDGVEGWGEAAVSTPYYGESAETVARLSPGLGAIVEEVAAGDPMALERLDRAVAGAVPGNNAAKAAISAALHDLVGKRLGVPVWRLWGLDPAAAVSSFTIGIDEPDAMREKVRESSTYGILKVKVGTPRDERILDTIRSAAPDARLRVDANTAWSLQQALDALPMLQRAGVELIEQPLPPDDLEGLRRLSSASTIPIIADESCVGLSDVARLSGAVHGINIKLAKCGSLREAVRMIHCARAHGMQVMLGCMVETTLGIAAAVQLAPLCDYLDLDGAALLADDPFRGPGIEEDGAVRFNTAPGLGVRRRERE